MTRRQAILLPVPLYLLHAVGRPYLEVKFSWIKQEANRTTALVRFYRLNPVGGGQQIIPDGRTQSQPKRELLEGRLLAWNYCMVRLEVAAAVNALFEQVNDEYGREFNGEDYWYADRTLAGL